MMGLIDSKTCGEITNSAARKAREVQAAGAEVAGVEMQYLAVLWTIAGHLARLSQALGQDPEPPPSDDDRVPF